MAAIKAMVDQVSSGSTTPPPPHPQPSSPNQCGDVQRNHASAMTIGWNAVTGAASYNVYRNNNKTNALPVTALNFTDTGLAAATTYSWTVKAADANGAEGARLRSCCGTTTGTPPPAATCYTASNYCPHHGWPRLPALYGITYANGSNQSMGLWNIYTTTT
jgi:chitodextrinase